MSAKPTVTFQVAVMRDGVKERQTITGERLTVQGFAGIRFVLHRSAPGWTHAPRWTVSEASTGRAVYNAHTKREAIEGARTFLRYRGLGETQAAIAKILQEEP